jgi:hypothetical protein
MSAPRTPERLTTRLFCVCDERGSGAFYASLKIVGRLATALEAEPSTAIAESRKGLGHSWNGERGRTW